MKIKFPLYAQILMFLLLNMALLIVVFAAFFSYEYSPGLQAMIEGPVGDQMTAIAWSLRKQTENVPASSWDSVLEDFGKVYKATFYIFDGLGQQIAGEKVELPELVKARLIMHPPIPPIFRVGVFPGHWMGHPDHPDEPTTLAIASIAPGTKAAPQFPNGVHPVLTVVSSGATTASTTILHSSMGMPSAAGPVLGPIVAPGNDAPPSPGMEPPIPPGGPPGPEPGMEPHGTPVEFSGPAPVMNQHGQPGDFPGASSAVQLHHDGFPQFDPQLDHGPGGPFDPHNHHDPRQFHHGPPFPPPGSRFMLHTRNPEQYWIATEYLVPTPARPMPHDSLRATTVFKPGARLRYGMLIAATPNLWQSKLFIDMRFLLITILAFIGLSLLIWTPFALRVTRRLGELNAATEAIARGQFDVQLKGNDWDEINNLASKINTLGQRLNNFVLGQRRFLGDIAHELCSPVARLQMALAVLEQTADEKHTEIIQDLREETEDMSALIQELLSFSKASIMGDVIPLTPILLKPLVEEVVAKMGAEKLTSMRIKEDVAVMAEQTLLKRAVGNVIRNSVRYASGPIEVVAERQDQIIKLKISDQGPGVPEESLKLLGEPFYRPEAARTRSSGGVGLGLAIVKTCVERCNGVFSAENRTPHGLIVTLQIPAAVIDAVSEPSAEPAKTESSETESTQASR